MTEMYAEKVSIEVARNIYMTHLKTDFPAEEIKPFAVIEKMWNNDSYYVYAFYEKAAEDEAGKNVHDERDILCAYAFLLADNTKRTLLLDYFAVCKDRRGEGYGSRVIALLREVCADQDVLVVEVEDDELPDISAEIRNTRKRRISFYTEAGCHMTDVRSLVWGVNYRIMILPLREEYADGYDGHDAEGIAEKVCALYRGMYHEKELRKHFAILSK